MTFDMNILRKFIPSIGAPEVKKQVNPTNGTSEEKKESKFTMCIEEVSALANSSSYETVEWLHLRQLKKFFYYMSDSDFLCDVDRGIMKNIWNAVFDCCKLDARKPGFYSNDDGTIMFESVSVESKYGIKENKLSWLMCRNAENGNELLVVSTPRNKEVFGMFQHVGSQKSFKDTVDEIINNVTREICG